MPITPRTLRSAATAFAIVAGAAAFTGAPAQASNSSLKRVITQQEQKISPLNADFSEAADTFTDPFGAVQIEKFDKALTELDKVEAKYTKAITRQKGSTSKGRRARRDFLAARKRVARALKTYGEALQFVFDEKKPSATSRLKTAAQQLTSADRKAESAAKRLGAKTLDRDAAVSSDSSS